MDSQAPTPKDTDVPGGFPETPSLASNQQTPSQGLAVDGGAPTPTQRQLHPSATYFAPVTSDPHNRITKDKDVSQDKSEVNFPPC